jgi:hypothetical protein
MVNGLPPHVGDKGHRKPNFEALFEPRPLRATLEKSRSFKISEKQRLIAVECAQKASGLTNQRFNPCC